MRNVVILFVAMALVGCGSLYDPRTGLQAEDVEVTAQSFKAKSLTYRSGQDRTITWQRDDSNDAEAGIEQAFRDFSWGTNTEAAARIRDRDNQRYERVGQQWADGVQSTVTVLQALATAQAGGLGALAPSAAPPAPPAATPETPPAAPSAAVSAADLEAALEILVGLDERLSALEAPPAPTPAPPADG